MYASSNPRQTKSRFEELGLKIKIQADLKPEMSMALDVNKLINTLTRLVEDCRQKWSGHIKNA